LIRNELDRVARTDFLIMHLKSQKFFAPKN